MLILRQSTAIDIRMGPFVDATDAVTPETGITLGAADQAEVLKANGAATAAMAGAFAAVTGSDGWYDYTASTTDTNTVGEIVFVVQDASVCLPVHVRAQVIEEAAYDAMYAAAAAGPLQSTEAGRTLDVSAGGAAGVDWANVEGQATAVDLSETDIQLADTVTTLTTRTGFSLAATGLDAISQSALGMVEIAKAVWDRVLSGATHNIPSSAGRRVRQFQEAGSYSGGFIYIDTVNGVAGTTDFENGVDANPVDNIADANTIAASLGISQFKVAPGSTITFAAAQTNQVFTGEEWTLALGGQNIAGSYFEGALVSGIGTGANPHFMRCEIGAVTFAANRLGFCRFTSTITLSAAADYYWHDCYSGVAGAGTPTVDFGPAVGNTNLSMRRYSGGVQIDNKDATGTDLMSLEGDGQLIVAASSSGAVSVRGNFKVTNTGGATITYDDNTQNLIDVLADTTELQTDDMPGLIAALNDLSAAEVNAEVDTALADYDGPTVAEMEARTLDAAAIAQLDQNLDNCAAGTASGTPTATAMVSDLAVTVDDQFKGRIITFDDDTTTAALRRQAVAVDGCTAASNTLLFAATELTTAPVAGDTFTMS